MIKYNVISNARNFARGKKKINMKKIFAIFFSVFVLVAAVPMDVLCAGACPKTSTTGNDDNEDIIIGNALSAGKWFFHCDSADCKAGLYVIVQGDFFLGGKSCAGYNNCTQTTTKTYVCDGDGGYSWESATNAIPFCDDKDAIGYYVNNSELKVKTSNGSFRTASCSSGGCGVYAEQGECKGWYCKTGFYYKDSECVPDTRAAQQKCEKEPSYGKWDGSKCLCGATDRAGKDDKGEGQTYEEAGAKCKCETSGHKWDGEKCVDPNVGDADACDKSGGEWKDGECKCDENSRGLKPVSGDKTCECIDNNKKYSQSDKMCVLTDQANCENTGGEWDDKKQTCTCDSKKNIKQEPSNQKVCICKNDDYGPDPTVKGCELTQDAKERRTDFENLKESCEKWDGAKWFPETWERELSNGKENENWEPKKWKCTCNPSGGQISADNDRSCVCDIGKGYYLKSKNSPYRCEQTDCATLQKKCNSSIGGGTRYIDEGTASGRQICDCKCNDDKKVYSLAENMCIDAPNPVQFLCNAVKPANSAMIDKDNNCVCISTGRRPENGKCPPAANSGSASGGGASSSLTPSSDDINKAKEKVSAAYKELKQIEFEKSHWKTASGNFNGARLASDSIAGVVLGTVGGVVTSNVIKKNQVKGGFENLQCTVGGQMVADYGDQFQVGIR